MNNSPFDFTVDKSTDTVFSEQEGTTIVRIAIKHKTLADIEMLIQMGFKEGFTMTLNFLEELLTKKN